MTLFRGVACSLWKTHMTIHNLDKIFKPASVAQKIGLSGGQETEGKEQMLGVARIMTNPGGESPEFAVLVGDPWQGRGVGAKLMEHLLAIAGERQLESISGIILGANINMLAFLHGNSVSK